jgi:dihydrofolate reductase
VSRVIAGMTQSLDGFVTDRNGLADALYGDLAEIRDTPYVRAMAEETGAVVMGRRTFEMAPNPDEYAKSYELQAPIFVITHKPPARHPAENDRLTFTFVTDGLASAIEQAKSAAGERAVTVVGGIEVIRQLLRDGVVNELRIDVMPVFLGEGTRLLDDAALTDFRLEKLGVDEVGSRTSLRFGVSRVRRRSS